MKAWQACRLAGVRLYHSTADGGKAGLEPHGFDRSFTPNTRSLLVFVAAGPRPDEQEGVVGWWWVFVDIPDDEAESYRYRYYDAAGAVTLDSHNFTIPFAHRAGFIFERAELSDGTAN